MPANYGSIGAPAGQKPPSRAMGPGSGMSKATGASSYAPPPPAGGYGMMPNRAGAPGGDTLRSGPGLVPSSPGGGFGQPAAVPGGAPGGLAPSRAGGPGGRASDPFSRPTSAMDVYRSSVPVIQSAMRDNISDAMAGAGFSGNRFGSYAMGEAAREGSRAGLQQNQLLTDLLYRQTQTDQDRALQAARDAVSQEESANRMQLDRMGFLGDMGRWEQGRQDLFSRLPYEDFERNKLGFLPMLLSAAQSPGNASQGVWGQNQTGGSPGFIDYATALAPIIAMMASDERLKEDIQPYDADSLSTISRLRPRSWTWRGTAVPDAGFVAQEVAEVAPSLVRPLGPGGPLGISIPGMMALSVDAMQRLGRRVEQLEASRGNAATVTG